MIRDRGKIKWQSAFFMPEHVKLLKQITFEDTKQKKPILDEQELEEIGIIVMDSLNYTLSIKITSWQNGFFKEHIGIIDKVDMIQRRIKIETDQEELTIPIEDITGAVRI